MSYWPNKQLKVLFWLLFGEIGYYQGDEIDYVFVRSVNDEISWLFFFRFTFCFEIRLSASMILMSILGWGCFEIRLSARLILMSLLGWGCFEIRLSARLILMSILGYGRGEWLRGLRGRVVRWPLLIGVIWPTISSRGGVLWLLKLWICIGFCFLSARFLAIFGGLRVRQCFDYIDFLYFFGLFCLTATIVCCRVLTPAINTLWIVFLRAFLKSVLFTTSYTSWFSPALIYCMPISLAPKTPTHWWNVRICLEFMVA